MSGAYEAVIGLEIHVQLSTLSKAFSASGVDPGAAANTLTDPVVLGLPGALPTFNRGAVERALRLGLACGCEIRRHSRFARKHYFYPDLPKGYQISQYDEPLCEGGAIAFFLDGVLRRIPLTRIHLEEDAGKTTHHGASSRVDLNRAGVPLCEVVSEPAMHSAAEAAAYMRALHQLVRTLGVSEANMEQGQLRCDANVSLRPAGSSTLGTRTELKNINSFRFVERAIEHEIARQRTLLEDGGTVTQETRLWDAERGLSRTMRGKEEANDYRYFPDPDLPPLVIDEAWIDAVRAAVPELPVDRYQRYTDRLGLAPDDARFLADEPLRARTFDDALDAAGDPAHARAIANWIVSELPAEMRRAGREWDDGEPLPIAPAEIAALVAAIDAGRISGKQAKDVFRELFAGGGRVEEIIRARGLEQLSDVGEIQALVESVLADHPEQVAQYRAGKTQLLGFFVGQVMKRSRGQANPKISADLVRNALDRSGD